MGKIGENMATYNIKKEEDRVIVEAALPGLPIRARDALPLSEVVREREVRKYVENQGIRIFECLEANGICNYAGDPVTGIFIFSLIPPGKKAKVPKIRTKPLKSGINVEKVIKDLTPASEPVIIEEKPKKRKRVRRDSETGNKTTS